MPKFLKGYKVELDPNKRQMTLFRKHFGAARWAFNYALEKKKKAFDKKEKIYQTQTSYVGEEPHIRISTKNVRESNRKNSFREN